MVVKYFTTTPPTTALPPHPPSLPGLTLEFGVLSLRRGTGYMKSGLLPLIPRSSRMKPVVGRLSIPWVNFPR